MSLTTASLLAACSARGVLADDGAWDRDASFGAGASAPAVPLSSVAHRGSDTTAASTNAANAARTAQAAKASSAGTENPSVGKPSAASAGGEVANAKASGAASVQPTTTTEGATNAAEAIEAAKAAEAAQKTATAEANEFAPPLCPTDMVLVQGQHCLEVVQRCGEYIEDPKTNPFARCRVFEEPTKCKGKHQAMRFCIDRYEMADDKGLPLANQSWTEAKALCEAAGKRLCGEREWLFACEGEEARPYPYGYVRTRGICNLDISDDLVTNKGHLNDLRQPVTANPECVSPFGVQNMVGNIDEWVVLEKPHWSTKIRGKKMISGLKGGWWGPLRNRCRPTTVDHDEIYKELQTGVRCCRDVQEVMSNPRTVPSSNASSEASSKPNAEPSSEPSSAP